MGEQRTRIGLSRCLSSAMPSVRAKTLPSPLASMTKRALIFSSPSCLLRAAMARSSQPLIVLDAVQ